MNNLVHTEHLAGENNVQYAYRVLYDNIMMLVLPPYTVLSEQELAEKLGISRTPLHSAMGMLKRDGLLEVYPQKSSVVSPIDIDAVYEGIVIRCAVEARICQEASGNLAPATVRRLRENLALQHIALEAAEFSDFPTLDNQFHGMIYEGLNYHWTWNTILAATRHFHRFRHIAYAVEQGYYRPECRACLGDPDRLDLMNGTAHTIEQHEQLLSGLLGEADIDYTTFCNRHIVNFKNYFMLYYEIAQESCSYRSEDIFKKIERLYTSF